MEAFILNVILAGVIKVLDLAILAAPIFAILLTVTIKNATWVEKVMLLPIYIVSVVAVCSIANITCPIPQCITAPCCWAYVVWIIIDSIKQKIIKKRTI